MPALIEAIIAVVTAISGILVLFTEKGRKGMGKLLANLVGSALDIVGDLLALFAPSLKPTVDDIIASVRQYGGPISSELQDVFATLTQTVFEDVVNNLKSAGRITPDQAERLA